MQGIRKQIHSALLNVSRLCEEFARKYPQYYPPPPVPYEGYPHLQYAGFPPVSSQYPIVHRHPWIPSNQQYPVIQNNQITQLKKEKDLKFKQQKISKAVRLQHETTKKTAKEMKKEQKKLEQLKRQREKQRKRLQSLKGKKKVKNTLKNQIKRDPRFAQKPKFPMSPYFLFLKEMRTNNTQKNMSVQTSKQFAEEMGKAWREMSEQKKTPYVTAYLKQKRIFDEKNNQFYEKYPDLRPKSSNKKEEHMYSVNDPKYQTDLVVFEDQQLETDLIDELNSQEDGYNEENQKGLNGEAFIELDNLKKRKDSLTLSDERLTSQAPNGNSPSHVVELD